MNLSWAKKISETHKKSGHRPPRPRFTGLYKECLICKNKYYVQKFNLIKSKTCCSKCRVEYTKSKTKGLKRTQETILKMRESQRGISHSPFTCFKKGHKGFRKKTGVYLKCLCCNKEFYAKPKASLKRKFCSMKCKIISQKGFITSEETKEKLRIASIKAGCHPPHIFGEKHYNWKGGITPIIMKIRTSKEYNIWRVSVFQRDNYTCQMCNKIGGKLCVHHIKSFSKYPELRFDINNGQTLCLDCHKLTDNYAGRNEKRK